MNLQHGRKTVISKGKKFGYLVNEKKFNVDN